MTTRRARRSWSAAAVAVGLLAAGTAAACALAAIQLATPADREPAVVLPLAETYLAKARGKLDAAPPDLAGATEQVRAALALSPTRTDAWLLLAYIERLRTERFAPEARTLVERSYAVGPLDPDVSLWRLQFVFEHWDQTTPSLRKDALRELEMDWSRRPLRPALRALAEKIENPSGRLALAAYLRVLSQKPRV